MICQAWRGPGCLYLGWGVGQWKPGRSSNGSNRLGMKLNDRTFAWCVRGPTVPILLEWVVSVTWERRGEERGNTVLGRGGPGDGTERILDPCTGSPAPHRWKEAQAAACIQLPHFPRCAQLIGSPQVLVLQTPLSHLGRQVVNETTTQLSEGKGVEKASWLPSAKVLEGSEGGLHLGE